MRFDGRTKSLPACPLGLLERDRMSRSRTSGSQKMHDELYFYQAFIRLGFQCLSTDPSATRRDRDASHGRSRSEFAHLGTQQVDVSLASYLHAATRYPASALCFLWGRKTIWLQPVARPGLVPSMLAKCWACLLMEAWVAERQMQCYD